MLFTLLMLIIFVVIICKTVELICMVRYKLKINNLLNTLQSKEDLVYMRQKDFLNVINLAFKRKGISVKSTDKCGAEANGFIFNNLKFVEIWKHGARQLVDVETAMNLTKCMQNNSIYRGMLITLGDFKPITKAYCYRYAIECVNGDELLSLCKEVQNELVSAES